MNSSLSPHPPSSRTAPLFLTRQPAMVCGCEHGVKLSRMCDRMANHHPPLFIFGLRPDGGFNISRCYERLSHFGFGRDSKQPNYYACICTYMFAMSEEARPAYSIQPRHYEGNVIEGHPTKYHLWRYLPNNKSQRVPSKRLVHYMNLSTLLVYIIMHDVQVWITAHRHVDCQTIIHCDYPSRTR